MRSNASDDLPENRLFVILFDLSRSLANGAQCDASGVAGGVAGEDGTNSLGEESIALLNSMLSDIYRQSHSGEETRQSYDIAIIGYSGKGLELIVGDDEQRYISAAELGVASTSDEWLAMRAMTNIDSPDDYDRLATRYRLVNFCGSRPMLKAYSVAMEIITEWRGERSQMEMGRVGARDIAMINIASGAPSDCDIQAIVDISHNIEHMAGGVLISNIMMSGMVDSRHNYSYPTDSELHHNPLALFRLLGAAASADDGRRLVCCNDSTIDIVSQIMSGAEIA